MQSQEEAYVAGNTKHKDNAICSTVLSEARKPVNFESPRNMLHWFRNHLLGIGPHLFFAHKHFINLLISTLSILHFFANLVAEYLVPVDFGAGHWKLPAQGLECGV